MDYLITDVRKFCYFVQYSSDQYRYILNTRMDTMQTFSSHRFPVFSRKGCVSSNSPYATKAGIDILQRGGNAVDAAVAVAAAMAVVEPSSTGLGGDAFCLYYNAKEKKVYGLNGSQPEDGLTSRLKSVAMAARWGLEVLQINLQHSKGATAALSDRSGRCAAGLNLDILAAEGYNANNPLPDRHVHTVTVPGTAAAWSDAIEFFGSGQLKLSDILTPAIDLAENGFPVTPVVANLWNTNESLLLSQKYGNELLLNGKAPRVAEIMKIPTMAESLKFALGHVLAALKRQGMLAHIVQQGSVARARANLALEGQAIVAEVQRLGGYLSLDDLKEHTSTEVQPISVDYKNYTVWEIPPNGLGITTLLALNILEGYDVKALGHNSADYFHLLIESLKLSFADSLYYVADPDIVSVPTSNLLKKSYAAERRKLISMDIANDYPVHGNPEIKPMSDTVYMTVADAEGNACSFINSNYMSFGTGIVPEGCGFALQNRGALFTLDPTKNNVLAPKKRPQHTIIPSMVTNTETGDLLATYGIMGGFMQPQAQVQNRGALFTLDPTKNNVLAPKKRPQHTIIPSMVTNTETGDLLATYGIMGGFMQPQAQVQVLLNMMEFGMDPQQALDYPRFFVDVSKSQPWTVSLEDGIQSKISQGLVQKGHKIDWPVTSFDRGTFGRGHVITRGGWFAGTGSDVYTGADVWWAAADPRCDGYPQTY
uniref:Glutathione hydrolase proenzyme n=1 Tax=Locusta migratoria migratoria TaxID=238695 RepID=A0A6G5XH10_LOCMI|nr:Glutathione hydrolase proenzyme [Locusta migratoria migratoria]